MVKSLDRERCFTRDASHELRTPLAVIKNAAELQLSRLRQTSPDSIRDAEINQRILEAAVQMDKTVHTLLMLAREENTAARTETIPLMPLIESSVLNNRNLLDGKPVEVEIDDSCNVSVHVQSGMLKVMLDNLISNAFQYTSAGHVTVSYANNALVVSDTGPGIDPTISERVTEPAVKGEESTGFGFGLSIVKRLCDHQKWQLQVCSNSAYGDNGTRIVVTFDS